MATVRPQAWNRDMLFSTAMLCGFFAAGLLVTAIIRREYRVGVPVIFVVFIPVLVGLAMYLAVKTQEANKKLKAIDSPMEGQYALPPGMLVPGASRLFADDQARRVCQIVASESEFFVPIVDRFVFEDGKLTEYAFSSTKPGLLATNTIKNRIFERLGSAIEGSWNISFNSAKDELSATQKSDVPALALPKMWKVIPSVEEATRNYTKVVVEAGVSENGPVSFIPNKQPHWLAIGASGGGKSVAVRAQVEQLLAYGFRLFFVDGKGADFAAYRGQPNVSAHASTEKEWVMVIHIVSAILDNRRALASRMSQKKDTSWRSSMYPIALVMDEWETVVRTLKARLSTAEISKVTADVAAILKVGREMRIHVLNSTQSTKAEAIPTDWFDQFAVVQSLGRPAPMAVRKAFPVQIQGEVQRLGSLISPKNKGRALVSILDEKSGDAKAVLYQSYFSYSPSESFDGKPENILRNWKEFKSRVSDRVPRIYPRLWCKIEYPEVPSEGKDKFAKVRDSDWVDLSLFSVEEIQALPMINLDDEKTMEPIKELAIYDPERDEYIANQKFDSTSGGGDFVL